MSTKVGQEHALRDVAEACARLAVAAGATPRTAVSCVLPQEAPLQSQAVLRKQLEDTHRQAKRAKNTLIKRYNATIDQLNGVMGTECSHIDPTARHCEMDDAQRELCAQAALNCARLVSKCAQLLPDEVSHLTERRALILREIAKANSSLHDSLDRFDEAQTALRALTARRYLQNSAAMSSRSKQLLQDKFLATINNGDKAISDIIAKAARHVSLCEDLTRNAIQIALLLGADVNVVAQVADRVVPVSYLRRSRSISGVTTLDPVPATDDVRRCVAALQRSRQHQTRIREHGAGWRENAITVRRTVEARLNVAGRFRSLADRSGCQ